MNFKAIIWCVFLLVCSMGCEQTQTLEPESEFKEKIVVFANLTEGVIFTGVTFTRTLPLNTVYDIKNAELINVTAYLKINGLRIIPLHYTKEGIYLPQNVLSISSGDTYELFATYNGQSIYSKTTIPGTPVVTNSSLIADKFIEASVIPKDNEVYGAVYIISGNTPGTVIASAPDFYEIIYPSKINRPPEIILRTVDIPEVYRTDSYKAKTYLRVKAFDKQYYDYYKTRSGNQQVNNSFTQGGGQVLWNVYGRNVIGLFIGSSEGSLIKPK
ncbi:MAG: DUF4249 family protein [Methanococcaceae archaeon]